MGTIRQQIIALLGQGSLSALQISQAVKVTEKEVCRHLVHIQKSVTAQGQQFYLTPCTCLACGFIFRDRRRLTRPGRCPRCRATRISQPLFSVHLESPGRMHDLVKIERSIDPMDPSAIKHLFLITGTTRGIGRALAASALTQPNSFVISLSRSAPFLRSNHQNITIDLEDSQAIGPALNQIDLNPEQTSGLIHSVLINNAGVLEPVAPIGDCDDALLASNIRVNLIAPLILSRHFYHFCKGFPGKKTIVNITSGASHTPYSGWSAYAASKAGLDMATRCMALEFAPSDPAFCVCAVAPGTVDTAMQATIRRCSIDQFAQVGKFHALKTAGALDPPDHTASALMRLLMAGRFENGGRYDLREMKR